MMLVVNFFFSLYSSECLLKIIRFRGFKKIEVDSLGTSPLASSVRPEVVRFP